MPRRKSVPKKVTKTVVYGRRGAKMSYKRSKSAVIKGLNYGRHRCVGVFSIVVPPSGAAGAVKDIAIPWNQPNPSTAGTTAEAFGFNMTSRWDAVKANWDEWAITGFKV